MRTIFIPFVFVASLLASTAHAAENNLRPGLWEMTTTSDVLKLVPLIPPEQMQNLMHLARQNGFDLPEIENGAAKSEVCITQEMADQKIPLDFYQSQSGCTAKNATRTGNKYRVEFACDNANVQGNGTAEGTFTSPERFSGRTAFKGVAQGNAVSEHADTSGRWVNASCKTVNAPQ